MEVIKIFDKIIFKINKCIINNKIIYIVYDNDFVDKGVDIYDENFEKKLTSEKNHKIENCEIFGVYLKFLLNNYVYSLYDNNLNRIKNYNYVPIDNMSKYLITDNKIIDSHLVEKIKFDKKIIKVKNINNDEYFIIFFEDKSVSLLDSTFKIIIDNVDNIELYNDDSNDELYKFFTYSKNNKYYLSNFEGDIINDYIVE